MSDSQPPRTGRGPKGARGATMGWLFLSAGGRIDRTLFVLGWLFLTALNGFFLAVLFSLDEESSAMAFWSILSLAAGLFTVVASVMLTIKRLHDINAAGAFAVLIFVPMLSILVLAILALLPGRAPDGNGDLSDDSEDRLG
jgi:uncharacterized membrane protein YhaH (DUF805 family)